MKRKKILSLFLVMMLLGGCSKSKKINESMDTITKLHIYYLMSGTESKYASISIDFSSENVVLKLHKYGENPTEKNYSVSNEEKIKRIILNDIFGVSMDNTDNSKDDQKTIWDVNVYSDSNRYVYNGFGEYPDYWKELWNSICEATGVDDASEFGIEIE